MTDRRLQFALSLALFALVLEAGCSANADAPSDEMPTERASADDEDHVVDNPCGNPRWDQPPPDVTSLQD